MISRNNVESKMTPIFKKSGIYVICIFSLFVFIGSLTTISPAYRLSSNTITNWTSEIDSSTFLYLLGMESKVFENAYPDDRELPRLTSTLFQVITSIKPKDPSSLLGNELPGFSTFDNRILIADEDSHFTNLPIESSPPLEEVLKDREAIMDEVEEEEETKDQMNVGNSTGDRDVVLIYNSHNRESFLPHLPGVTDPDLAHHKEVNITKVSDRLAKSLKAQGIGTSVDHTDIMNVLNEKGWSYGKSYAASREVISETIATNKDIHYIFDLHRDSASRKATTIEIDGIAYARIYFVIGTDYAAYEKNFQLATKLHNLLEEKYPGLSRGRLPKGGAGTNGVFNQDLSENALTIEIGGVDNKLEELYRTADALADVFSEFYWDAEKVNAN